MKTHIRWMIRRDMPEVLAIDSLSFSYPWTEEEFLSRLRKRDTIGMIAELDDAVFGFMVYRFRKAKIVLDRLAVHPDHRFSTIGNQLINKLKGKLSDHRRTSISISVRETNLPAQVFLRRQGFLASGVDREHYEDTGEDAFKFNYTLPQESISDRYDEGIYKGY